MLRYTTERTFAGRFANAPTKINKEVKKMTTVARRHYSTCYTINISYFLLENYTLFSKV
nr:MAG TPA: hypothetical protein [Caudoviricetes sp.]